MVSKELRALLRQKIRECRKENKRLDKIPGDRTWPEQLRIEGMIDAFEYILKGHEHGNELCPS